MRRLWMFWGAVLGIFGIAYSAVCWVGAGRLTMPPRKPFELRHRAMLADLGASGIRLRKAVTVTEVPYLCCEPGSGTATERGRVLRDQLLLRGWSVADFARPHGTLVLLHGWGGRKEDMLRVAERFCAAGFRCLIPDLPGHGENRRAATAFGTGESEARIAGDLLEDAAGRFGFSEQPAALWGMSMGGAFAIAAAAEEPEKWNAMVVVCTFDELEPVVAGKVCGTLGPWGRILLPGLAVAVRIRAGFWPGTVRPLARIANIKAPTMIVHGDADDLIPMSRGRRIYDRLQPAARSWIAVSNGGHGGVLGTPQEVFADMAGWLLRHSEDAHK